MSNKMDVKKSNNNYYPVKMEELPIYELERKKIEDKLDVLDYKLKEQHKKLEEIVGQSQAPSSGLSSSTG